MEKKLLFVYNWYICIFVYNWYSVFILFVFVFLVLCFWESSCGADAAVTFLSNLGQIVLVLFQNGKAKAICILYYCFVFWIFIYLPPIVWIYVHAAKLMTAVTFKTNFQFETIFASESNIYLYFCFLLQIHLFGKCVQTNRDIRNVQICAKWPLYHPHPSPLCPRWMKYHVHPHTRITYIQ